MSVMPPYPVLCHAAGCDRPAAFKIAARWSDGLTRELKTYSLVCPDCVRAMLADARDRQRDCRLVPGESTEPVGVYELVPGQRDRELARRDDLERA